MHGSCEVKGVMETVAARWKSREMKEGIDLRLAVLRQGC